MKVLGLGAALAAASGALIIACSSKATKTTPGAVDLDAALAEGGYLTDGGGYQSVCAPLVPPTTVQAACTLTLDLPGIQTPAQQHIAEGTAIDYCTNPPSGGAHYPIWANFGELTHPIPWPYLVHDEEHGAILLLYNCPAADGGAADAGCPDLVDQLRQVMQRAPADPICDPGVKRFIIAPAPTLPSKVAAAAWGATLTGDCVDGPTFDAFVAAHYGKGPEVICAEGEAFP